MSGSITLPPCRCWRPPSGAPPAWAALALVHGIGSHGEAFAPLARDLARAGVIVCAVDLPGHGRSPGPRGALGSWDDFRCAVAGLLRRTAREAPGLPQVVLGHSLGGTIALDYVQRHPGSVAGTVVSNPALAVEPTWRLALAGVLAGVWPGFTLPTGIPLAASAHDPQVLERIRCDPLRHDRCSVRLATAWQQVAAELLSAPPGFPGPLLVLQSRGDTVICPDTVARWVAGLGEADVTLKTYGDSLHELFDDREREWVITDLLAWLRRVCQGCSRP
ncbi:MAG: hypothetical protein ER33_00625 [Cyanobium sp. CACIAM 14]|nr:MAG: hypothetical protein ER33_00625 [Cyanobium sp. CACIAM 14]